MNKAEWERIYDLGKQAERKRLINLLNRLIKQINRR